MVQKIDHLIITVSKKTIKNKKNKIIKNNNKNKTTMEKIKW
jgi:hypothetical protein